MSCHAAHDMFVGHWDCLEGYTVVHEFGSDPLVLYIQRAVAKPTGYNGHDQRIDIPLECLAKLRQRLADE